MTYKAIPNFLVNIGSLKALGPKVSWQVKKRYTYTPSSRGCNLRLNEKLNKSFKLMIKNTCIYYLWKSHNDYFTVLLEKRNSQEFGRFWELDPMMKKLRQVSATQQKILVLVSSLHFKTTIRSFIESDFLPNKNMQGTCRILWSK